jgi:poly(A) polymerase
MTEQMERFSFDEAGFSEAILFNRGHGACHHGAIHAGDEVVDQLLDLNHVEPAVRDDLSAERRVLLDDDPNAAHWTREAFEQHDAEVTCLPLTSPGVDQMLPEVLSEVQSLTTTFSNAGFSLYLVGGIVRDIHLGVPIDDLDFDLTTEARPDKIRELVAPLSEAVWSQGEKFGTIGCRIDGRPYEITTHRAESYSDLSRKPKVVFGDDIEVDLSRRDFTLNAMAIDTTNGILIDPFDGLAALRDRALVTPIAPEVSFSDDPLRILRAARFLARLDLTVADPVRAAAVQLIDRMSIVSEERIRDEFDKLLAAPHPSKGLRFLSAVGAWSFIATTIDVSELVDMGADLDRSRIDRDLRRLAVFSRAASSDRGNQLEKLRYSNSESREMRLVLAGFDLVTHGGQTFEATTVRRLVDRVGYESMPLLLELLDVRQMPDRGLGALFADLDERENLASLGPELTGEDIMDLLGIDPGPEVGAALSVLQERRFEDGPLDRASEVAFLLEKYRRRG